MNAQAFSLGIITELNLLKTAIFLFSTTHQDPPGQVQLVSWCGVNQMFSLVHSQLPQGGVKLLILHKHSDTKASPYSLER